MGKVAHQQKSHLTFASGINSINLVKYPDADCFLVATGISKDFYTLDPYKLEILI